MARSGSADGLNQDDMRRQNLSTVVREIARQGPVSRTRIASVSGLIRPSVANLVTELEVLGLVQDVGVQLSDRAGRPASLVQLDGSEYATLSVEMNVGVVKVVGRDLWRAEIFRENRSLEHTEPEPFLDLASEMARRAVQVLEESGRTVLGIAVIVPAVIGPDRQSIHFSAALGWKAWNVTSHFDTGPNIPVILDNYANFAAVGDAAADDQTPHLVHLEAGEGVGAGTVMNGEVQRGGRGYAGAIGHISLDPSGPECGCGRRGCLEAYCSVSALLARTIPEFGELRQRRKISSVMDELNARAHSGDSEVIAGLADTGLWLGKGAAALINVLSPDVLTLGGYVPFLAPWILPTLLQEVERGVVVADAAGCRVELSPLGSEAAELGASLDVISKAFSPAGLLSLTAKRRA